VLSRVLAGFLGTLAGLEVVGAEARLAGAAIDQHVVKQVVVPAHFPHLGVHDDTAIQADHRIRRHSAGRRCSVVVSDDHVTPPGILDISLQLHAQRAIIPEAADAAVDLARLKNEAPPLA
jgi:hypothetical protein